MSNKEQLQTNNQALDSLIARVNTAKNTAASLPSAGSGGGTSGNPFETVDTFTVTLVVDNPNDIPVIASSYYYDVWEDDYGVIDDSGTYFLPLFSMIDNYGSNTIEITVIKGSWITFTVEGFEGSEGLAEIQLETDCRHDRTYTANDVLWYAIIQKDTTIHVTV